LVATTWKEIALRHAVLVLIGCLGAGGCGSTFLLNETIERKEAGGGVTPRGSGCYQVETGPFAGATSSGGGWADEALSHSLDATGGVATVRVHAGDKLLAERRYDEAFADSGRVDVIKVASPDGRAYEFRYWGSESCEAVMPEEPR
jgi:hypothetical protein